MVIGVVDFIDEVDLVSGTVVITDEELSIFVVSGIAVEGVFVSVTGDITDE